MSSSSSSSRSRFASASRWKTMVPLFGSGCVTCIGMISCTSDVAVAPAGHPGHCCHGLRLRSAAATASMFMSTRHCMHAAASSVALATLPFADKRKRNSHRSSCSAGL